MTSTNRDVACRPTDVWPALPQAAWSDTCATLHLWMQVVGKIRMALTPAINHCWNVTLYPTARGLTTMPMWHGTRCVQIDFDFLDHVLLIETSDGGRRAIPLKPMSVAEFYQQVMAALDSLGDRALSAGADVVAARASDRFTRFDGNLAGLAVPSPAEFVTSATRLEGWATCPFAYFLHEVLKVEPVENPEDRLTISPLELGSLVHEILEKFVLHVLARSPDQQPGAGQGWSEADGELLVRLASEICDSFEARGVVGRPIFWQRERRRLIAALGRLLQADAKHRRERGTRPVAAELAFGLPGARIAAVAVGLADGRSVRFRGKADRIDMADDGSIEVLDRPGLGVTLNEDFIKSTLVAESGR